MDIPFDQKIKFCGKCGAELKVQKVDSHYDIYTGERVYKYTATCSRALQIQENVEGEFREEKAKQKGNIFYLIWRRIKPYQGRLPAIADHTFIPDLEAVEKEAKVNN